MITLRNLNGEERQVEDGLPYNKLAGEFVVSGDKSSSILMKAALLTLEKLCSQFGLLPGECIHKLTDALGIEQCPRCQRDEKLLNRIRELGVSEVIARLKMKFVREPDNLNGGN